MRAFWKTISTWAFALLCAAAPARGQADSTKLPAPEIHLGFEVVLYNGAAHKTATFYSTKHLTDKVAIAGWGLVSDGWGEALVGATFAPAPSVELGLFYGFEQDEKPHRGMATLWIGNDRTSLLLIGEDGGSGYWYNTILMQKLSPTVAAGAQCKRFVGCGPRAGLAWNTWLDGYVTPAYDFEDKVNRGKLLLGLHVKFY